MPDVISNRTVQFNRNNRFSARFPALVSSLVPALVLALLVAAAPGCAPASKNVTAALPGTQSTPLLEAGKTMYIGIMAPFSSSFSEDYRSVLQHFKYMFSNLVYVSLPEQIHENAGSAMQAAVTAKADYLMLLKVEEWQEEPGFFGAKNAKVRLIVIDPHTNRLLGDNQLEMACRAMPSDLESPVMECLRPQVEEWKRRVFPGAYDLPRDLISAPVEPAPLTE